LETKIENEYELRSATEKGKGIFATKYFKTGNPVMTGIIKKKEYKRFVAPYLFVLNIKCSLEKLQNNLMSLKI